MSNQKITNEMLYELLKEFKRDVYKKFEQIEKSQERLEHNQERLEHNQERLEDKYEKSNDMLMDIWKSRDSVVAKVTWDFIWKATTVNTVILLYMLFVLKIGT